MVLDGAMNGVAFQAYVEAGDIVVDTIGVGDAPGANLDETCVLAAIKKRLRKT
ncbi:hypothetical protein AGRO_2127 [Agrobacterium sp. ATCC 31749]|nr:hypothetical protein AGRO_2127 [Agrobacterium sp. ATCC 31749]